MSPPSREEILSTLLDLEMSEATFQEPFCSNPSDAPGKPMEVGGRKLIVSTRMAKELAEFSGELSLEGLHFWKTAFSAMTHPASITSSSQAQGAEVSEGNKEQVELDPSSASDKQVILLPCKNPPSRERVQLWLEARIQQRKRSQADPLRRVLLTTQIKNQFAALNVPKKDNSQIEGPSIANSYGFKISMQNLQEAKALHEVQYLTLMGMDIHARTRRDLEPDPEFDPICALFYCLSSDAPLPEGDSTQLTGAIVVDKDHQSCDRAGVRGTAPLLVRSGVSGLQVTYTTDEKMLFQELIAIMRRFDPDILVGYEVQMHSWGYLLQRAAVLGVDLCQQLSRVPGDSKENRFAADRDEYGADTMTEINIIGRITLNLWRVMKTEVTLNNYTFENVAFHVLHQRFPVYSPPHTV